MNWQGAIRMSGSHNTYIGIRRQTRALISGPEPATPAGMNDKKTIETQAARPESTARGAERRCFLPAQLRTAAADLQRAAQLWMAIGNAERARICRERAWDLHARARKLTCCGGTTHLTPSPRIGALFRKRLFEITGFRHVALQAQDSLASSHPHLFRSVFGFVPERLRTPIFSRVEWTISRRWRFA